MVEVKPIDVCCSSQDPAFPALNLVRGASKPSDERKQWLCSSPDEKFSHVTLTYEKPFVISSLEIKNNGSAYVQVEGGCLEEPGRLKVLWRTQSLMTPSESRLGAETDGIYIFLPQDLATAEKDKAWDVLKITCSQPFNRLQKYGLSHVIARSALPVKEEIPSSPAHCVGEVPISGLKREPVEDEVVNIVRAHKSTTPKATDPQNQMNSEVSSSGCSESSNCLISPVKQEASPGDEIFLSAPVRPEPSSSVVDAAQISNQPDIQSALVKQETFSHGNADSHSSTSSLKRRISESDPSLDSNSDEVQVIKRPAPSNIVYKPFNKLLEGVKLVISGFENPFRAEIRSRALQMGASYCPYWTESCTHLICAFLYTPKYRQAATDSALIVTRDWIDQCYNQRKRLPWRRFALNPSDRCNDGGGLEIWEAEPSAASSSRSQDFRGSSSFTSSTERPMEASPVRVTCSNPPDLYTVQNRPPNNSTTPFGPGVKKEVPERGECSSANQNMHQEMPSPDGISRQLCLQSCGASSSHSISVKREINTEESADVWQNSAGGPSAMNCGSGIEASHHRRSQMANPSPKHHLIYNSISAASGANVDQETIRSAPLNTAQMEPGPDGYAGYYRPISQPCAVPHSSPSATYLVPPVIMLPQTLPQYFVPISQQFQAPPPPRDTYMARTIPSPQVHGQHIRVIQHSNKTPSEEEGSKQN